MTTAAPVMPTDVITAPATVAPSQSADIPAQTIDARSVEAPPPSAVASREMDSPVTEEMPALLEHPIAGMLMFVVLAVCGFAAAAVVAGSVAAGLALVGVVGGAAATLVAVL
ncbi:hypothetical protein [Rhodococcus sp. B50]|uniref:hypothetical protein n=1 Tax=Rhodococcus sp. B50 TaxID=2682847 RepID=UPI001BD30AB4|nr:hypothetical protein [Rhodococcus sp. B50]MBS9373385.1 hypothetical protein [Rhodococcus sp. B50]